jgi:hypothetical protein
MSLKTYDPGVMIGFKSDVGSNLLISIHIQQAMLQDPVGIVYPRIRDHEGQKTLTNNIGIRHEMPKSVQSTSSQKFQNIYASSFNHYICPVLNRP